MIFYCLLQMKNASGDLVIYFIEIPSRRLGVSGEFHQRELKELLSNYQESKWIKSNKDLF